VRAPRSGWILGAVVLVAAAVLVTVGTAALNRVSRTPLPIPSFVPPAELQPPDCEVSIQSMVAAADEGATVTVPACLARETVTIDKPLTLQGEPGAAIRGSDIWTEWRRTGSGWRSRDAVPQFEQLGACATAHDCLEPAQVYLDGVPLVRVAGPPGPDSYVLDAQRRVTLGADPRNRLVEVTTRTTWVRIEAAGVTVTGFDMRHAANPPQTGAILNVAGTGRDTISGNTLAYAHGAGAALDHGSDNAILDNDVGYAGQLGIHLGGGVSPENGRDNVVRGNRVHHNNLAGFDPEWETGGLKATVQTGLVIEDNQFEHNAGPGIWCDIYCSDVTIARNSVHDNTHAGIMYEVSTEGRILNNAVWANGAGKPEWGWGAGILVSSSGTTEVADNTSAWNQQAAISIISQSRSDWPDVEATGISVHDNTMAQAAGWLAFWAEDWDGPLLDEGSRNEGYHNRYGAGSGAHYHWGRDIDTLAAFEATPGEENAVLLEQPDLAAALAAAGIPAAP